MARPLRLEFPGAVYHLTARGNARQGIFEDDGDRRRFLDLLSREVQQQGWRCYAYCLMDNHYHLLVETPDGNLAGGMRRLNGAYTQAFNHRHRRVGHLFQGRYKSIVVDKDSYLLELCRYIVLNPVRARMVATVDDWPWSSYPATARAGKRPAWLDVERVWSLFGETDRAARTAYRRFIQQGIGAPSPWQALRGQIWLGSQEFLRRVERLARDKPLDNVPLQQANPTRPTREDIVQAVSDTFGIPVATVLDRTHQPAFRAAVYLLRRAGNLHLKEVAVLAKISPPRISQIQRRLESEEMSGELKHLAEKYKVKN